MKKLASAILAAAMLLSMSAQMAFADTDQGPWTNGELIQVTGFTDKNGNPISDDWWVSDDYSVSFTVSAAAKKYLTCYIDDSTNAVYIKVRSDANIGSSKDVTGKVTAVDRQTRERYTAEIDFTLEAADEIPIEEIDYKEFALGTYFNGKTRFRTTDKQSIGTLRARFESYETNETVAYYDVKIVDQPSLFLAHNENADVDLLRKYPDANLRFLTWDATPKFDITGTLGIPMEKTEYLYKRSADGALTQITGTYNSDRDTLDFKTDTLGSYVISDVKLSGTGAAASTSSSSVAPPASSSKPAASSVAPPPASSSKPASSSVAPPPASSAAPSSSSIVPESPSSEPASSEPESSEPESSEPAPEVSKPEPPASSSTAAKPEDDAGSFPVVPVVVGAVVVLVGGLALFITMRGKGGKKKNFDSWDD